MLHRHDPALRTLTLRLRDIVIRAIAPCHEYIYAMKWRVVLFYGTSEKIMNDSVCAIVVYKKFINLGFPRGVDLDDPTGALEGTGVGFRHINVKTPADLDRPEIPDLLRKARENTAGPGRPRRRGEPDVVTKFKPTKRSASA